jgi:hypothetical protein
MYAKVPEAHKRGMNRRGLRPKNPGVNKIAESLKVDHSTATRCLKADVPVKVEPDGTGVADILAGNKRGPSPGTEETSP